MKTSTAMQCSLLLARGPKPRLYTFVQASRNASMPAFTPAAATYQHASTIVPSIPSRQPTSAPLSVLPLSSVLRSHLIMSLSSRPLILAASTSLLRLSLQPQPLWLFDVERNRLLRWLLKHTFYAQFCSGENLAENRQCTEQLRKLGYSGIIMEYAREVLDDLGDGAGLQSAEQESANVASWRDGLLETVRICHRGDFIGLKWSGMGANAHHLLKNNQPPSATMEAAMIAVCEAAAAADVKLLPAAEPQNAQASVDAWTLRMAERYNKLRPGYAVLYNTYQTYLKSTAATLSGHLKLAQQKGFTLGIKLVRGAYLHSEVRHLIWDTIDQTHACYNGIATDLVNRVYGSTLKPSSGSSGEFPPINIMIASHNQASVQMIRKLRDGQLANGKELVPLAYAQLYGMADEVSCSLLQDEPGNEQTLSKETPQIYKCATWGSMKDCLNYLLRRAAENKDALNRTKDTRDAMRHELWRRARTKLWSS